MNEKQNLPQRLEVRVPKVWFRETSFKTVMLAFLLQVNTLLQLPVTFLKWDVNILL